ncbi:PH domain-containing protein [Microbacterium oryzae]|uniref:PH domain-containing protein n=1 Tax=Microbacterium oryzae TaxID=743009 RepID=UPI0025AEF35C|nr:PH domain-containing protein [Microbacterium oryzae]MDN3309339.1 PH domain-containing protein [Microbacterium oryzae]
MGKHEKLIEQAQAHLDEGETVDWSVFGLYEAMRLGNKVARNGVLIATDRRVLFYAKRLGGYDLESFPYRNISSFESGKSLTGSNVTFFASGNQVRVKMIQPDGAVTKLVELVRQRMSAPAAPVGTAPGTSGGTEDVIAQIEQLGKLRDAGVLTEEEFATKKAEMLGRL